MGGEVSVVTGRVKTIELTANSAGLCADGASGKCQHVWVPSRATGAEGHHENQHRHPSATCRNVDHTQIDGGHTTHVRI